MVIWLKGCRFVLTGCATGNICIYDMLSGMMHEFTPILRKLQFLKGKLSKILKQGHAK